MIQAKVNGIGKAAMSDEPLLLFFNDSVKETEELKNHVIIQEIAGEVPEFDLKEGSSIFFDDQEYQVVHVGPVANRNLTDINHVAFVFTDVPAEDAILNGVYLTPQVVPTISVGTVITYK